jgi:fumarate reductase flavoprotein subunit
MSRIGLIVALIALVSIAPSASGQRQNVAPASDLASFHVVTLGAQCDACHDSGDPKSIPPEQALAAVNARCTSCHGDAGQVSAAVKPKLRNPNIDPHASHLVAVDCTVCHAGHAGQTESYCLKCHAFDMPMPAARRAATR